MDRNIGLCNLHKSVQVVPRKGDVDRNAIQDIQKDNVSTVVPRKGDVDRNAYGGKHILACGVVPRKGDVDRNTNRSIPTVNYRGRPPQGGRG